MLSKATINNYIIFNINIMTLWTVDNHVYNRVINVTNKIYKKYRLSLIKDVNEKTYLLLIVM